MVGTTFLIEFCLLLPHVIALQTSQSDPHSVFVSSDEKFCAEAPENIAKDALDLFKSMPRGKMYDGMFFMGKRKNCKDLGYTYSAGEDPCYPGLLTFYPSRKEGKQFYDELRNTLKGFGDSRDLSLKDAIFVDNCKCNANSYVKNYFGKSCDRAFELEQLSTRNAQRTFVSTNKLFCAEAPKSVAKDALDLFKSMPRGKLYVGMALSDHKSCEELGYKSSAGEDPCYPGLKTFYRNEEEGEQFSKELQSTLKEYGNKKNMTLDDANLMDTCKCKDKSYAKSNIGKWFSRSCDKSLELELSTRNPPRTFLSLNKLFCAEAPKSVANDALNLFKSMPRGKLYDGIVLSDHKSCEDLGYKSSAGEDPCYPGLKTFYRNKEEGERFFKELQSTLKEFGERKNLSLDDANLMDTCKCKDKSYAKNNIGKFFSKSCDKVL